MEPPASLQARLDALVDRAPGLGDLFAHRLGAMAAARWRALGRPLPEPLAEEERFGKLVHVLTPALLERVQDAYGGRLLVLKGPEVARHYPDPRLRPHHDLDLLVDDADAAQRALLAGGARVGWDRPSPHHELPLVFPDFPLVIEVHSRPKWPTWSRAPAAAELLAGAAASEDGRALALAPAAHAVVVAAHAWAERPLRRVLDLLDVHVLLTEADRGEATALAQRWGVGRMWEATLAASDALLGLRPEPWTLRTWARSTPAVREQTPLETLLERCLAPFSAQPPGAAARAGGAGLVRSLVPRRGKTWAAHSQRAAHEHPALSLSAHEGERRG